MCVCTHSHIHTDKHTSNNVYGYLPFYICLIVLIIPLRLIPKKGVAGSKSMNTSCFDTFSYFDTLGRLSIYSLSLIGV